MKNAIKIVAKYFDEYSLFMNILLLVIGVVGLVLFVVTSISPRDNGVLAVSEENINALPYDEDFLAFADIEGQVEKPGVYEISRGDTVLTLVEESGGFSDGADMEYIQKCMNLSERLGDQQKVYIPGIGEHASCNQGEGGGGVIESSNVAVSLNNASKEELESLSGIGPSTAQKIIDGRPYASIEDLLKVSGIGPATLEKIRDNITL